MITLEVLQARMKALQADHARVSANLDQGSRTLYALEGAMQDVAHWQKLLAEAQVDTPKSEDQENG